MRLFALFLALFITANACAFSISTKTEMKNGLRTTICINKSCETFEGAISVQVQDFSQQPLLLNVKYLEGGVRAYNWDARKFLDELQ